MLLNLITIAALVVYGVTIFICQVQRLHALLSLGAFDFIFLEFGCA